MTLREENSTTQQRLDRTVEALRIAGSNAQKARMDADSAEATVVSLDHTLKSLQTVVTETKRASQILHQEHQQVAAAAASIEAKLLQKEGDLARSHKELKVLRESNEHLEHSHSRWKEEQGRLELSVERQSQELEDLKRVQKERDAMERARKERADKVEQEWRQAQALLVEATAGQAQAEQTKTVLEETVQSLRKANEVVHEQLAQHQATSRKENERLSEALAKAEKEAQQLRIEAEASQETTNRLRLDKQAAEKQVTELKTRAASSERRLKELTNNSSMVSPENNNGVEQVGPSSYGLLSETPATSKVGRSYSLPPLIKSTTTVAKSKENSGVETGPKKCSICSKLAFGIMKACQCGNPTCRRRAHISCVNRIQPGPSVSHPGTPAPSLPTVFCGWTPVGGSK